MAKPKEPTSTEYVIPEQVLKSISKKKLTQLLNHAQRTKNDVDELVGTHREQIADAVENHNLHKGAFAMVKVLKRIGGKDPGKLRDQLDYFYHYCDIGGIDDLAASAPRLDMGDKPGEGEQTEEETGRRGRTVTPFPAAAE